MRKSLVKFSLASSALIAGMMLPMSLQTSPVSAVELPNGEVAFSKGPRLIRAATTSRSRNSPVATYQFTIEVPEDAQESLGSVTIQQRTGGDTVAFKEDRSSAFFGDSLAGGPDVSLSAVGGDIEQQPGEVTVMFDQPIEPGNTVTVEVKPKRNPSYGGVYQLGVTAYPEGQNSQGLYLGSRRININNN